MRRFLTFAFLLTLFAGRALEGDAAPTWQTLAPGMDLRLISSRQPGIAGDSRITVVRIDPRRWELVFAGISQGGEALGRTAREWCQSHKLTAAINAGMFNEDFKTHTGYLRHGDHVNSARKSAYQSVAAFGPRSGKPLPHFRIFDLDAPGVTLDSILEDYASAVQNLRLIKKPGINQWKSGQKKWSEAALGEDQAGNILFIFSRSPFTMHDFNEELLAAGIGVVAAQHLEGGPEAQLYLNSGGRELEMVGSFGSGFHQDDHNSAALPIPNVLGVRPRASVAK